MVTGKAVIAHALVFISRIGGLFFLIFFKKKQNKNKGKNGGVMFSICVSLKSWCNVSCRSRYFQEFYTFSESLLRPQQKG